MSLADDAAALLAARSAPAVAPVRIMSLDRRILVFDIERVPGRAEVDFRGLQISGDFWDLSGWKSTIHRRIRPDEVVAWPRTVCAAARWYGQKTMMFTAEWQPAGHAGMVETLASWFNEADILVGHNISGFDIGHVQGEMSVLGYGEPSPYKVVDTLRVARSRFKFESNKLDSLCERLGIPGKVDHYDPSVAQLAVFGDVEAQQRLKTYNAGDVEATEALYDRLRPWIKAHPGVFVDHEHKVCANCGGELEQLESSYRAVVLDYPLLRCTNCGKHHRGRWFSSRATDVRPVS